MHSAARAKEAIRSGPSRRIRQPQLRPDALAAGPVACVMARDDRRRPLSSQPDHLSLYLLELYPNCAAEGSDGARMRGQSRPPWTRATPFRCGASGPKRPTMRPRTCIWARSTASIAAGYRAIRNLERCAARLSEPAQRQVLAGGLMARVRVRRALDRRRRALAQPVIDNRVRGRGQCGEGRRRGSTMERLSPQARLEEALFTGLRLTEGIDCAEHPASATGSNRGSNMAPPSSHLSRRADVADGRPVRPDAARDARGQRDPDGIRVRPASRGGVGRSYGRVWAFGLEVACRGT